MTPSWQLKKGQSPPPSQPGDYDGRFPEDYEFVAGSGDLDACNGRVGVTPEFPAGTSTTSSLAASRTCPDTRQQPLGAMPGDQKRQANDAD